MIDDARRHGLSVMVGCMSESSVGISAIAQLLPLLDYVDMDGALLIARDIARGVRLEKGRAIFPETAGIGVEIIDPSVLETLPPREFQAGMYEALKYGIIRDASLAGSIVAFDPSGIVELIARCCEIKAEVVAADERESGL